MSARNVGVVCVKCKARVPESTEGRGEVSRERASRAAPGAAKGMTSDVCRAADAMKRSPLTWDESTVLPVRSRRDGKNTPV